MTRLDPDDLRAWVRVDAVILDRVEGRDYKPGQLLPPIDVLRSEAGLRSRQPVAKALVVLENRAQGCAGGWLSMRTTTCVVIACTRDLASAHRSQ